MSLRQFLLGLTRYFRVNDTLLSASADGAAQTNAANGGLMLGG